MFKTAGLTDDEYGAFLLPSMTDGQAPGVFLEGGAIAVPKNAPHKEGALKAIAAWLTAPVQTIWSEFIGDSSPNPNVVATDPVIQSVAEQIAAQKPTILNRYYESLPPKLVQSTISTLGGFMVDPSNPDKTMSDLANQAEDRMGGLGQESRASAEPSGGGPVAGLARPTSATPLHESTGALA